MAPWALGNAGARWAPDVGTTRQDRFQRAIWAPQSVRVVGRGSGVRGCPLLVWVDEATMAVRKERMN